MLWDRGFRPFFLLASAFAGASIPLWIALLAGAGPAPAWLTPSLWHGHEMLFGFVAAAMAGFLLTAVPVWTGTRPVSGPGLASLAGLWLAGRAAMLAASRIPPPWVAALDLAFLPALAGALALPLLRARRLRNIGFLAILLALFLADLAMQLEALGVGALARQALRIAVDLVVLLVVVVGGRIIPAFTRNAFAREGIPARVRSFPALDGLAVAAVAAVPAADLLFPHTSARAAVAGAAGLAVAARLAGWQGLRTGRDPLLWSLHLGMVWVALGLAASAASGLGAPIPETAALHALTAGAMGATILSVMARVALGHTGRPLVAPRGMPAAFAAVSLGALLRTLGPILLPAAFVPMMAAAGTLWSAPFLFYLWRYGAIRFDPRADGRPG